MNVVTQFFKKSATKENAELAGLSPDIITKETPLSEVPDAAVGSDTTSLHFLANTKLGWMAWKEREASLADLFERTFSATRFEMKMTDNINQFGIEMDIPTEHLERFIKYFKGKLLCNEIDKVHGIEPLLGKYGDVKVSNLKTTMGSTIAYNPIKNSVVVLEERIRQLEKCSGDRTKEVEGIWTVWETMQTDIVHKLDLTEFSIQERVNENVLFKFDAMEQAIMESIHRDFSFLRIKTFASKDSQSPKGFGSHSPNSVGPILKPLLSQASLVNKGVSSSPTQSDSARSPSKSGPNAGPKAYPAFLPRITSLLDTEPSAKSTESRLKSIQSTSPSRLATGGSSFTNVQQDQSDSVVKSMIKNSSVVLNTFANAESVAKTTANADKDDLHDNNMSSLGTANHTTILDPSIEEPETIQFNSGHKQGDDEDTFTSFVDFERSQDAPEITRQSA